MLKVTLPLSLALLLTACGDKPPPVQVPEQPAPQHVFSDLTGTIDKAKTVEGTLQQAEQRKRAAIE